MNTCLTHEQMSYFLSLLEVKVTEVANGYIIHATSGDVWWMFNGACYSMGIGL